MPLVSLRTGGGGVKVEGRSCPTKVADDVGRYGFWRGYASRRRGGGGGRRDDDGEPPFHVLLNRQLKDSGSPEVILELVDEDHDILNFIHVSTAVNTLYKAVSAEDLESACGKMLNEDERICMLIDLIKTHCKSFREHAVANVLHGLAVLQADCGVHAVDEELAVELVRAASQEMDGMIPQGVSNIYRALAKLEVAAVRMPTWGGTL